MTTLKGKPRAPSLSKAERAFIRNNAATMTTWAMATELGRAHATVKAFVNQSLGGRVKTIRQRVWSGADRDFLKQNSLKGWPWCALKLGVSVVSVRSQAARWGLERPPYRNVLSQQGKFLFLHRKGFANSEIADALGVTSETVRRHLRELGLKTNPRGSKWRKLIVERAKTLHTVKKATHSKRASLLGWPHMHYCEAIVLSALELLGSGDKRQIARECQRICDERAWKKNCTEQFTINYLVALAAKGFVISAGRGSSLRRYRILSGLKAMQSDELAKFSERFELNAREINDLWKLHRELTEEVLRHGRTR